MAKATILKPLIKALGMNVSSFEREIKTGPSSLNKAISRNSDLKFDTIEKITAAYPNVNREWLITGNGSMFNTKIEKKKSEVTDSPTTLSSSREDALLSIISEQNNIIKNLSESIVSLSKK